MDAQGRPAGGVADVERDPAPTGLPWRGVLLVLCAGSLLLVASSWVTLELVTHPFFQVGGGGHAYLNVGVEGNVPSWWSVAMLVAGGAAFLAAGWLSRATGHGRVLTWWSVGAILVLFALDEGTMLHEKLYEPAQRFASTDDIPFVWLVLGVPLAVAVVAVFLLLARGLPRSTRQLLAVGIVVFFAGAVGLEAVASFMHTRGAGQSAALVAIYHAEELLEMLGAALIAVAPLRAVHTRRLEGGLLLDMAPAHADGDGV
ncbi:hypothetical protein KZX45_14710 [Georgenia sp. EYE_87]|uniref:hypothetical protein n=1 Tax=Georgenia sp. EYE_87 TaxID=2853448 RepID=UPI00200508C5|nr:hypothetical protein [Georgenia sp. EYE_87]MCK6211798.1 hypothetical protein [Georgenia sp. EYE_87]